MPIGQRPVWNTPSKSSGRCHMFTIQNARVASSIQKQ